MVQLIKPHDVKVVTKQGECTVSIVLELNINLNSDGLQVATKASAVEAPPKEEETENVEWTIPDFSTTKIKFGKYQGEK